MSRNASGPIIELADCENTDEPLYRRLTNHIRTLILEERLAPGHRLPSTRQMSQDLGCSRNTVIAALDELIAEDYLVSKQRSGTFVTRHIPVTILKTQKPKKIILSEEVLARPVRISPEAERVFAKSRIIREKRPAFSRQPDVSFFPFELWADLFSSVWKNGDFPSLNFQDPLGYMPLREAIVEHLAMWRGVICNPEQVMITMGTTHSLHFLARLLLQTNDRCWVENPGFIEAKSAIYSVGALTVPIPCDQSGLIVSAGIDLAEDANIAFVTPSHHHPLGMVMGDDRRQELLKWAAEQNAWIIEDDHDSEIRHAGQPRPTLKSMDETDCVIYVATFSKVLFQSLRLGFMVLPQRLVQLAKQYRSATEVCPPISIQPVMERFLKQGHFAAHLRRMRKLYMERKATFRHLAAEYIPKEHVLQDDDIGTHLVLILDMNKIHSHTDVDISKILWGKGINATPLSEYYKGAPEKQGLVLGYGALLQSEMVPSLEILSKILHDL